MRRVVVWGKERYETRVRRDPVFILSLLAREQQISVYNIPSVFFQRVESDHTGKELSMKKILIFEQARN